jgi:ketosteroid isomerase-like protein
MMLAVAVALMLQQAGELATIRQLETLEHQLAASYRAGDCEAWAAILAPEWSVIHITGNIISKAEALRMCKEARAPLEDLRADEVAVRLFGDTAIVTGRTTVTVGGGSPATVRLRFTDVFMHRSGRWLVVASHATRIGS